MKLTPHDMLTIIAIANMKDKTEVDPNNHFGLVDEVRLAVSCPKESMQELLWRTIGVRWDGVESVWPLIVKEHARQSAILKASAEQGVRQRRLDDAARIVRHATLVPGSVAPSALDAAEKLLMMPPEPIPEVETIPEGEL